ncbi:GntR family transcriptional regulator [Prauserella flavalba]|uniref:GntR family transcriptional regulator n=1 Tax=Prauserella flavalba TaxID=1477506 RepID=UPI0036E7ED8B
MLDRRGALPLYEQLAAMFRERIDSREWPAGSQLPSERELCELFGVSRITVRHAIGIAEQAGLLDRVHGVGTFVAQPTMEQPLDRLNSFEQTLAQRGLVASTVVHTAELTVSDLALSSILRLDATAPVAHLRLVGRGNDQGIVVYDSYFPPDVGEEMTTAAKRAEQAGLPFSTLDLYRNTERTKPDRLAQTFEAIVADRELGELLGVDEGWPILRVTSVLSQEQRPVEYRTASYRGDRYKFAVDRSLSGLH